MTLAATPKIELHLHLEGAAPPAFIRGLASEKREDISGIFDERGGYAIRDFWHFLKVYEAATSVIRSPEDYRRLTLAVLEESAASGVIYCETFISPDFCGGRDLVAWRDYLAAIEDAAAEAEAKMGVTLRAIVTPIRHFGPEKRRWSWTTTIRVHVGSARAFLEAEACETTRHPAIPAARRATFGFGRGAARIGVGTRKAELGLGRAARIDRLDSADAVEG